jgi:transcription elongation factor Elf1
MKTVIFHGSRRLDESKLEPNDPHCPFCLHTARQCEHVLQETPEVLLLKCSNCHAVSASRMPTQDALNEYYASYYESLSSAVTEGQITFDNSQRMARRVATVYRRNQKHSRPQEYLTLAEVTGQFRILRQ